MHKAVKCGSIPDRPKGLFLPSRRPEQLVNNIIVHSLSYDKYVCGKENEYQTEQPQTILFFNKFGNAMKKSLDRFRDTWKKVN